MPITLRVQGHSQQRSQAGQYRKEDGYAESDNLLVLSKIIHSSQVHQITNSQSTNCLLMYLLKDSGINVPLTIALELRPKFEKDAS